MFVFSPIFRIYVVTFLPFKVQIIDIKRFTNTRYELIHTKSYETIAHVIPQKGAYVEVGNGLLFQNSCMYVKKSAISSSFDITRCI